jgi:dolichol kinase
VAAAPGRALLIGAVNLLFFGTLALACLGLADSSGVQLLAVPGLALVILMAVALCGGLAAVVEETGARLLPAADPSSALRRTLLGTTTLTLACALPLVGWFLLLPYLALVGLGACIIHAVTRYRQQSAAARTQPDAGGSVQRELPN